MPDRTRFKICRGRWGLYFCDGLTNEDMPPDEICSLLNTFVPLSEDEDPRDE